MSAELASAIYTGTLTHARTRPIRHAFRYPLYLFYVDLDELARGDLPIGDRPSLLWFRRMDYLPTRAGDLARAARGVVRDALDHEPRGPVRVLTNVRAFGYVFNPVTFYYCFEEGGDLGAVVAEIHNTPWGERHTYVLRADASGARDEFEKAFHVSPFFPMQQRYAWRFTAPSERLEVAMTNLEDQSRVFEARLELERRPLTRATVAAALVRQPSAGLAAHAAIYGQALRLYLRGAPFFTHPKNAARAAREAT